VNAGSRPQGGGGVIITTHMPAVQVAVEPPHVPHAQASPGMRHAAPFMGVDAGQASGRTAQAQL